MIIRITVMRSFEVGVSGRAMVLGNFQNFLVLGNFLLVFFDTAGQWLSVCAVGAGWCCLHIFSPYPLRISLRGCSI